jgi:hypothetical protein
VLSATNHALADDQVTWDPNVSKMLIYDVGMTSEHIAETDALADIADALNKTADATMLRAQRDAMASKLRDTLWNEAEGMFFNYQVSD